MKAKIVKAQVVYTPEQYKELGFDGEVSKFMRDNKNTAIVGDKFGEDMHVIQWTSREQWTNYVNPYTNK